MDQTFSWPFSPSRYTSGLYLVLRVPYQVLRVSRVPGLVLRVPGLVLRVPDICLVLRFSGGSGSSSYFWILKKFSSILMFSLLKNFLIF